jgi:hypothetical protein
LIFQRPEVLRLTFIRITKVGHLFYVCFNFLEKLKNDLQPKSSTSTLAFAKPLLQAVLRCSRKRPCSNDLKISVHLLNVKKVLHPGMPGIFIPCDILKAVSALPVDLVIIRLENKKVLGKIVFIYFGDQPACKKYPVL